MTTKAKVLYPAQIKTVRAGLKVIEDHCENLFQQAVTNHYGEMRSTSLLLVKDLETLLKQARELRDELRAEK